MLFFFNQILIFLIVNVFLLLNFVEYEVKEENTDKHDADKHSKAGHVFDEEMVDNVKICDEEMQEVATHKFQGMSDEVLPDKLEGDTDTTIGDHKGVNNCKREPYHEVLPD